MPFRFQFESVLHFRQSIEHQQELRLRVANQKVSKARHIIEKNLEALHQNRLFLSEKLARGTDAAEIQFFVAAQTALQLLRRDLERELARLGELRDQQQRMFVQARRERQTLESLRDQKITEYKQELARREQARLDELFLLRRSYTNRS